MKIQIQGIEELPSKSNELVKSVSKLLNRVDPDLSDSLLKALPKKDELFTDPVHLELLKQWELGYRKQVDLMIADIEKVIEGTPVFKSLDDGISYFRFDPTIQDYVEESNEVLAKSGGPYIGPRGGKWADPEHKIPWKEDLHGVGTKERYSDEEAEKKIDKIGESLYSDQAWNPDEKDDTGFSSSDMQAWRFATSLLSKRAVLKKYRRQIFEGWGADEYHKLGLSDKVAHKSEIKPYYDKQWGSLMLPVDGRISREAFDKFRSINKRYNVWFSNGSNFVKESYLDDFDFEAYKKELSEIGILVHPIKGDRKTTADKKDPKDLTADEALDLIKRRKAKDTIVLKKIGKDKFAFWSTFSTEFNDLFSNKRGGLSGIFNANKQNNWARETHELSLVEEAIEKIKERMPNFNLVIDEKGLREAQIERDNYQAELRKPIPEVQDKLNPKFELFLYQNEGVRFLDKTNGNALIGDEMGLGKSLQTLAWVAKGNHKTIVVAPKVVRRTWLQEAEKFFPGHFKGAELIAEDIRKDRVPDLKDKNIVTVNYESLDKFYPYLKDAGFDTVVVDESHRMKNPKAKQTQAIQKIAKEVKHHILLSGTAIKNKKEELFTQLDLVAPGKFKSKADIKFATIGGLWQDMKDHYIAHRKIDVLKDLPEKTTTIMRQEISGLPDYKGKKEIGDIARLKANIAKGKASATVDLANEILDSSDSKIIIFTDSVEAAKAIYESLGDKAVLHHGQMSDDNREKVKEEFQKQDKAGNFISDKRIFVTTRQSMAVGATLTAADKVIFNDLPWTAADLRQAEDRAHRIGQKNNVNVYWNTADNNMFDSSVADIVMKKYELSKKVNQGKKLTDEEIAWMEKPVTVQEVLAKIRGGGDIVEERDLPVKEDKPTPVIPIEQKDTQVSVVPEEPVKKESIIEPQKEKPVKSEYGSKSNPLNALPKDTKVLDASGISFSKWDGKLALVNGPDYYSRKNSESDLFDPETMSHKYYVRYAVDEKTKKPLKAYDDIIGKEPNINSLDRKKPYEEAKFTSGTYDPYNPSKTIVTGTFGSSNEVWVKTSFKDLTPSEKYAVEKHLKEKGYMEPAQTHKNSSSYLNAAGWKKAVSMPYIEILKQDNYNLVNAVDDLLDSIVNVTSKTPEELNKVWREIPGILIRDKKGDLKSIIHSEVRKKDPKLTIQEQKQASVKKDSALIQEYNKLSNTSDYKWDRDGSVKVEEALKDYESAKGTLRENEAYNNWTKTLIEDLKRYESEKPKPIERTALDKEVDRLDDAYSALFDTKPKELEYNRLGSKRVQDMFLEYSDTKEKEGNSEKVKQLKANWIKVKTAELQNDIDKYKDNQVSKINNNYEKLRSEFRRIKQDNKIFSPPDFEEPKTKHLEKVYQNALSHNLDRVVIAQAKHDWMESRLEDLRDYAKKPKDPIRDITTGKPITKKEEPKLTIPVEQPVKKKRGRPPKIRTPEELAEMNKPKRPRGRPPRVRLEEPKQPTEEQPKKKRGRPPGSKNKIKRVPIKTSPQEEKRGRGRPPKSEEQKATEDKLSTVSANKVKLKKIKSDDVHDIYKPNIVLDEDDARIAMRNLRDSGINVIIIPGENGVIKIRKGFEIEGFEDKLEKALKSE